MKENQQKFDSIGPSEDKVSSPEFSGEKKPVKEQTLNKTLKIEVTDNKIPHRDPLWYVIFTLIFLASTSLIIYLSDWALLFFVIIFSGVTLWRGHMGSTMILKIDNESIKINEKHFSFEQIESWYFSKASDDFTVTFQMTKKYLPRLTFIFTDSKYLDQIRKKLSSKVPETEPREESFIDFFIRKLKI